MVTKKSAAKKKVAAPAPSSSGRPSQYTGKAIKILFEGENPRRKGSHGFNSWTMMKNELSVADYVKAGGRIVDLAWEVGKGRVELI